MDEQFLTQKKGSLNIVDKFLKHCFLALSLKFNQDHFSMIGYVLSLTHRYTSMEVKITSIVLSWTSSIHILPKLNTNRKFAMHSILCCFKNQPLKLACPYVRAYTWYIRINPPDKKHFENLVQITYLMSTKHPSLCANFACLRVLPGST